MPGNLDRGVDQGALGTMMQGGEHFCQARRKGFHRNAQLTLSQHESILCMGLRFPDMATTNVWMNSGSGSSFYCPNGARRGANGLG